MPSTPSSDSGKTVSDAESAPGDATPPDTDLGMQTAQPAPADAEDAGKDDTPGASSGGTGQPETPPNPA